MKRLARAKLIVAILLAIIAFLSTMRVYPKKKPNWAYAGKPEFLSIHEIKEFVGTLGSDRLGDWDRFTRPPGKAHMFVLRNRVVEEFTRRGYLDAFSERRKERLAHRSLFPGISSFGYFLPEDWITGCIIDYHGFLSEEDLEALSGIWYIFIVPVLAPSDYKFYSRDPLNRVHGDTYFLGWQLGRHVFPLLPSELKPMPNLHYLLSDGRLVPMQNFLEEGESKIEPIAEWNLLQQSVVPNEAEAERIAFACKTETEGWLPGETIQEIALYRKTRPDAIYHARGADEFIWVVRFGRRCARDSYAIARVTQEYWINAQSGYVRAVFPVSCSGSAPPPTLTSYHVSWNNKKHICSSAVHRFPHRDELFWQLGDLFAAASASGPRIRIWPSRLWPFTAYYFSLLKPFASADLLSLSTSDSNALQIIEHWNPQKIRESENKEELVLHVDGRRELKVSPHLAELCKELSGLMVPRFSDVIELVYLDSLLSHENGVPLAWMCSSPCTVWLIRLGRDVDGFGYEGDLVWVVNQSYNPLGECAILPLYPYLYRQVWINAARGQMFSILSANPDEKAERVRARSHHEWWEWLTNAIPDCKVPY